MSLTIRKVIVLGLIGAVLLLGNILFMANWLAERGVVDWARHLGSEYLTGTAVTIIVVLLILLVSPRAKSGGLVRAVPCATMCWSAGAATARSAEARHRS